MAFSRTKCYTITLNIPSLNKQLIVKYPATIALNLVNLIRKILNFSLIPEIQKQGPKVINTQEEKELPYETKEVITNYSYKRPKFIYVKIKGQGKFYLYKMPSYSKLDLSYLSITLTAFFIESKIINYNNLLSCIKVPVKPKTTI